MVVRRPPTPTAPQAGLNIVIGDDEHWLLEHVNSSMSYFEQFGRFWPIFRIFWPNSKLMRSHMVGRRKKISVPHDRPGSGLQK